jgi:hypothetical protein
LENLKNILEKKSLKIKTLKQIRSDQPGLLEACLENQAENVKTLKLDYGVFSNGAELATLINKCTHLEKIILLDESYSGDMLLNVVNALNSNNTVTYINIDVETHDNDITLENVTKLISKFQKLETISFQLSTGFQPDFLTSIECNQKFPSIKKICINHNSDEETGISPKDLSNFLSMYPTLQEIVIPEQLLLQNPSDDLDFLSNLAKKYAHALNFINVMAPKTFIEAIKKNKQSFNEYIINLKKDIKTSLTLAGLSNKDVMITTLDLDADLDDSDKFENFITIKIQDRLDNKTNNPDNNKSN